MAGIDTRTGWGVRLGLALLLVLVHLFVWRPVRDVLVERVAYPLAASVETPRSSTLALSLEPRALVATAAGAGRRYHAPAGLAYLVTAFVLVIAFPRRLYWLWLWLALVALGGLAFGAFVLGVGWTAAGFAAADFGQLYLAPALNVLALVAPFLSGRLVARDEA